MKHHKTTTLEVSKDFQNRFDGAHQAARRLGPEFTSRAHRGNERTKWERALVLWHKVTTGAITGPSAEALKRDHAAKFNQFDRSGGRIPAGVK